MGYTIQKDKGSDVTGCPGPSGPVRIVMTGIGGMAMKGHMNTQMGEILIDNDVIAKYAGSTAMECFGVVGMAYVNMKDGLVKLLRGDSVSQGVNIVIDEAGIDINLHIIVAYGVSISAVANNLISNVKYKVEEFTGMKVEKINVYVEGVRVMD